VSIIREVRSLRSVTVPLERNGTERAGDEESAEVDEIELPARLIQWEDFVDVYNAIDRRQIFW